MKIDAIEGENNMMWSEIQGMTDRLPDKEMIPEGVNMLDRKQFNQFPDALHPTKDRSPPKDITKMRKFNGIEIKPLIPKYV